MVMEDYEAHCNCFHSKAVHVKGKGRCKKSDSYGLPCGCPSYDPDEAEISERRLEEDPDSDWQPEFPEFV
jgi:hypothetical protein